MFQVFCNKLVPEEVRRLDVVLEQADHVFFSGEEVIGQVQIELAGCLTVQGEYHYIN